MADTCSHKWDTTLHRACPVCAIAECERRLRKAADAFHEIERATCPMGSDYGHGEACRIAHEAREELLRVSSGEAGIIERVFKAAERVVLQTASCQPVGHDAYVELRATVNAVRKERGLKPITTKYARVARDPGPEEQR